MYYMGPTALLPLRRKACWGFFRPKNPMASAGFEPANLGTKGQHATPRPPKPLVLSIDRNKNNETLCRTSIKLFIVLLLLTARKSQHKFDDESEERRHLIYNYPVTYTGDDTVFQQCYTFEIWFFFLDTNTLCLLVVLQYWILKCVRLNIIIILSSRLG